MARPPIIIGGAGRSGTTLLRMLLDSHPDIACGPELKLIPHMVQHFVQTQRVFGPMLADSFGIDHEELARSYGVQLTFLLDGHARRQGKRRAAEKTPNNVNAFPVLPWMFPGSPLVHLVRDGRDVVCSLLEQDWVDAVTGQPLACTRDARAAAEYWASAVRTGLRLRDHPQVHTLRYEDLVAAPEPTLRALLAHCGEDWDPAVLRFHERRHAMPAAERASHARAPVNQAVHDRSVGRWRRDLHDDQLAVIEDVAGDLLVELGYDAPPPGRPTP